MELNTTQLKKKANQIRDDVIAVAVKNGAGHIAPSLSSIDILVALYYRVMSYKAHDPFWQKRDRLVFSKGHGCYAVYAILADMGILPKKEWENFYTPASTLLGCAERRPEYGLEAACGSLGHGLPIAVGLSLGARLKHRQYHTFCILGDGELQEGSTWEALQFAVKYRLSGLTVIIDANRLQAMDFIVNVLDTKNTDKINRLKGFGLKPVVVPGHDMAKLVHALLKSKETTGNVPKVIIAQTIKGFGLKCMENVPKFHFRIPTHQELSLGKSYTGKADD
ncbi:MAG: transketolase [Candidatus Omnitrophica bacterium]|nr:transketolase [Candidatus Omnitrophota bacterium]